MDPDEWFRALDRFAQLPFMEEGRQQPPNAAAGRCLRVSDAASRNASPFFAAEHELLRAQVRRFVEEEIKPHAAAWESEGFVPSGMRDALVADRVSPRSPTTGDDVVLRIQAAALTAAGVRPGDLLVATEAGALTDAISCSLSGCKIRRVADGPSEAHLEGHIAFAASP